MSKFVPFYGERLTNNRSRILSLFNFYLLNYMLILFMFQEVVLKLITKTMSCQCSAHLQFWKPPITFPSTRSLDKVDTGLFIRWKVQYFERIRPLDTYIKSTYLEELHDQWTLLEQQCLGAKTCAQNKDLKWWITLKQ